MANIIAQDILFFIKHEDFWVPIGCEIGHSISETTETLPTTTRDNGGWATELPTTQSYTITVDALMADNYLLQTQLPFFYIRELKRNKTLVEWRRVFMLDKYIDSGQGWITEVSDSNAAGEDATFSFSIRGFGAPTYVTSIEPYFVAVLGTGIPNGILVDDSNRAIEI